MNITISKTNTLRVVAVFTTIIILAWGGNWVLSSGFSTHWFASSMPIPQDQPAMQAVTEIYSADPASDRSAWEDKVCSDMTAKGCSLFRSLYAPAIWAATSQKDQAVANMLQVVETLDDGSEIWKVAIARASTTYSDIYIHVEADPASGQWLLNRILFTQEAAKYVK